MLVLVTYDICVSTPEGRRRLQLVAKKCEAVGRRVQNSVFECLLDAAQLRRLQNELTGMIAPETDSLRFYNLGDRYTDRVELRGAAAEPARESALVY